MKQMYFIIALLYCAIPCFVTCTEQEIKETEYITKQSTSSFADNAVLIFLDDSEEKDYFGAMSSDLLSALIKNAGPIIVSGSLIFNIKEKRVPQEKDPNKLLKRFNVIEKKYGERTDQENSEEKSIILSVGAFTPDVAQNWIIKEINPFLYLLLPKDYLKRKKITNEQVEAVVAEKTITATEQVLGLKVNHMKTVTINDVKKQETSPEFAHYFVENLDAIFVINSEYTAQKNKEGIPTWALYMSGHGESKHFIAYLSLSQFKDFLTFLKNKITTRLLVYSSCYASGVNAQLVYKENQSNIDITYPFPIIAQALTDAATESLFVSMGVTHGKLEVKPEIKFDLFLDMVTTAQTIDYRKLIELVNNTDYKKVGFAALPQIKIPGVPWFSVLDNDKTLSIGSILAKTRTTPLDVGTFSKKDANPLVILVYAQDIPFELIINTKAIETNAPPAIISMVTGNAVHHLKKISSKKNTIEALLNSFLTITSLSTHKVFVIDEITAPFSDTMKKTLGAELGTITDVIVDIIDEDITIIYMHNGMIYKATLKLEVDIGVIQNPALAASKKDRKIYADLLHRYGPKISVTSESIAELQAKATATFAKKVTYEAAYGIISHMLDTMPDNVALRIQKITGVACSSEGAPSGTSFLYNCWFDMLLDMAHYEPFDSHKVLWIDALEVCSGESDCTIYMTDIIIDIYKQHARIFYKDYNGKNPVMLDASSSSTLSEDYMPAYKDMFAAFAKSNTLEKTQEDKITSIERASVHQQLTPDAIKRLQDLYGKKIKT